MQACLQDTALGRGGLPVSGSCVWLRTGTMACSGMNTARPAWL